MTDRRNDERTRGRRIAGALAVASALALGTTALVGAGSAFGFPGRGGHDGPPSPEEASERAAFMAFRIARAAQATPEQQARIEELLQSGFSELGDLHGDRRELHDRVVEKLAAAEIDREALEQLRAEKVAELDRLSRRFLALAVSVADVLDPEQRARVVAELGDFHHFDRRRH